MSIFKDDMTILMTYLISSDVKPSSFSSVLIFCVNLPVNFWIVLKVTSSSPLPCFESIGSSSISISGISSPISSIPSIPGSAGGGISPSIPGSPILGICPSPPSNGDGGNSGFGTGGGSGGGAGMSPISLPG